MKTQLQLLSFLFFLFSPSLLLKAEPVYDTDGDELQADAYYYIRTITLGGGGGVRLTSSEMFQDRTCPPLVVQSPTVLDRGSHWRFTPLDPNEGVIQAGVTLTIQSFFSAYCDQGTMWTVSEVSLNIRNVSLIYASTGSSQNPLPESMFQIRKAGYENTYELFYCCSHRQRRCRGVGLNVDTTNGLRHLTPDPLGSPFRVFFQKAGGVAF